MSSDMSIRASRQDSDELHQLNEHHQKRKEQVVQTNERQLREIESKYNSLKNKTEADSRAAINHIKENSKQLIDSTRTYSQQQLNKLRKNHELQIDTERAQGKQKIDHIANSSEGQAARLKSQVQTAEQRAKDQQRAAFEKARLYEESQEFRKKTAADTANLKIRQAQEQNQEVVKSVRKKNQEETEQLNKILGEQTREMNESYNNKTELMRNRTQDQLKQMLANHQKKEALEKAGHVERLNHVENESQKEVYKIRESNEVALQSLKQELNRKVIAQNNMYRQTEGNIRQQHAQEAQKIHKQNDLLLFEEKTRTDAKRNQLSSQYKSVLDTDKSNFETEKLRQQTTYLDLLAKNQEIFKRNLTGQKDTFDKQAKLNEALNREVLNNQNAIFKRELTTQKAQFVEDLNKYNMPSSDPFYKLPSLNAELIESENFYTLKAQIPEHEKKNIDVKVQKDSIVLAGNREFNEKLESDDKNQKIQSNNYQSYRQEFKINFPIYERAITQTYEGGVLTVTIPKLGSSGQGV